MPLNLSKKIIDLVLYGNFWIAIAAFTMLSQSRLLLGHEVTFDHLSGFVFSATLFLYAAHRIVGISRLKEFFEEDRYQVIASFKWHIFIYAVLSGLIAFYCFLFLERRLQWTLLLPGIFSLAYVMPILGKRKRLRDVNHVKIYLIAIVWAFVTVLLPAFEKEQTNTLPLLLMFTERAIFIFLITLPFDIRDLKVDAFNQVKTIPAQLGLQKTMQLAYACGFVFVLLVIGNYMAGFYSMGTVIALVLSVLITISLVSKSSVERHDYFYSGWMDGMMVLQFFLVWLSHLL
jgi:4-hydroxybenzoate polyprenyltransferase